MAARTVPPHTRSTSTASTGELYTRRFDFDQPSLLLSCLSVCVSLVIFALSMLDLGMMSFYTAPIVAGLTALFHLALFLWRLRRRCQRERERKQEPTANMEKRKKTRTRYPPAYTIPSIAGAALLGFCWLAPLAASVFWIVGGEWKGKRAEEYFGPKGSAETLLAQCILSAMNLWLMALIAIMFGLGRRQHEKRQILRKESKGSLAPLV